MSLSSSTLVADVGPPYDSRSGSFDSRTEGPRTAGPERGVRTLYPAAEARVNAPPARPAGLGEAGAGAYTPPHARPPPPRRPPPSAHGRPLPPRPPRARPRVRGPRPRLHGDGQRRGGGLGGALRGLLPRRGAPARAALLPALRYQARAPPRGPGLPLLAARLRGRPQLRLRGTAYHQGRGRRRLDARARAGLRPRPLRALGLG